MHELPHFVESFALFAAIFAAFIVMLMPWPLGLANIAITGGTSTISGADSRRRFHCPASPTPGELLTFVQLLLGRLLSHL